MRQDRQEESDSVADTEAEEDEGIDEEGDRNGDTPRGAPLDMVHMGGGRVPLE